MAGTFRWSGSTILIFTPQQPLPYATSYQVTVDASATAISGRKLAKPVTFRFTTPTATLEETRWYRRGGMIGDPIVVMMRFNQPVRPADVAAALSATLEPHQWAPPSFSAEQTSRLKASNPAALEQFERKVQSTREVAASRSPVQLRLTNDWDKKEFPPSPRLVVFETVSPVPPEAWVKLTLGRTLRSPEGPATPTRVQTYTIEAEHAFFITGFTCTESCDPDSRNPIELTSEVEVKTVAPAISVLDVTDKPQPVAKAAKPAAAPRLCAGPCSGVHARRRRIRRAASESQIRRDGAGGSEVRGRADTRISMARDRRQLALPCVHQLRRRAWRLGEGRGDHAAVLLEEFAERHSVGGAASAIRVDADAPATSGEGLQADTFGAAEPSQAGRHARPDSVSRSRPLENAARWHRSAVDSGEGGHTDSPRQHATGSQARHVPRRRWSRSRTSASQSRTVLRTLW